MKITKVNVTRDDQEEKLFPMLLNNFFHVTGKDAFKKIRESGFINSNKNNAYTYTFPQSRNNYGARNGMVCLIDLRQKSYAEAKNHASDGYNFLRPRSNWKEVIFLLLDTTFHKDLRLQARFNSPMVGKNYISMERFNKGTYVPEIECWYPEKITLNKISKVLIVEMKEG